MDRVGFKINDISYTVGSEVTSDVTLLDYIRYGVNLRGTKYMCRQAGCGACIVAAVKKPGGTFEAVNSEFVCQFTFESVGKCDLQAATDRWTKAFLANLETETLCSFRSIDEKLCSMLLQCMVSITSCQDWEIQTIEQLGNRKNGYHIIQQTLANYNGSQCGYCSPGWVMSMYCLLHEKKELTMLEVERSFGSNICRCTGYRPILEAFKTFAKDCPKYTEIPDIEELSICKKSGKPCAKSCSEVNNDGNNTKNCDDIVIDKRSDDDWCVVSKSDYTEEQIISFQLKDGRRWYRPNKIIDVYTVFKREGIDSYMLVAGNTAKGAYPILEYPRVLIDISNISELKKFILDQNLIIGAGVTLSELLNIYRNVSEKEYFRYLKEFYKHLEKVAHIAVRNLGTIGGNLMIKYQHREFQSDLYIMFETVGAELRILTRQFKQVNITMEQFLSTDMKGAIILNVKLPPLGEDTFVKTFKVMPRSQNAHAIVNFGSLYKLTSCNKVVQSNLTFGGLTPGFSRATATEKYLVGKLLFTNECLQGAIKSMEKELVVTEIPPEPSAFYRKKLAIGLFYRSLLLLCPKNILNKRYQSGSIELRDVRPVSSAKRSFETNPGIWPLTKPMPKIEALIQCAGEAFYTEDMPNFPNEIFGDLVLSTVARGTIISIDASKALKYPGVIAVYTAKDIPGLNSFTPADDPLYSSDEEILCSSEVKYYNQPVAIVVAESIHKAELATKMVVINYKNVSKPVLDIKHAAKDPNRLKIVKTIPATEKGTDVEKVVQGSNTIYGQYHFTLENMACVVRPTEEGLEAYVTTQWTNAVQTMISRALNIDGSRIDVYIRRIGGGFGIKISRSILIAIAASLVVTKLNRPCRFIQSMQTTTRAYGKRFPCTSDYKFGVNKSGVVQYANYNIYEDNGYKINEKLSTMGVDVYFNCYNKARWNFQMVDVITDTAKNTWNRSPGTLETLAMTEMIMEQISYELSLDPLQIRLNNLGPDTDSIKEMLKTLISESQYEKRRVDTIRFNTESRWKKRGLRFVPIKWTHNYSRYFDVNLSVYHVDGSVAIVHGGVEIGQGINTRAVQIAAYFLNIPIVKIQIKGNNTIISPNGSVTGGSITTQSIGIGVERCCKALIARLEPVKNKMDNPSWEELIAKAFEDGVDLQTHGFVSPKDMQNYSVYGVAFAEVEIDVLTGEKEILRVDIVQDAGRSITPEIDVGQVEGAFTMGLGYWSIEELIYDKNTGELLTDRPWNYYVPQATDIPQDFRVSLRKNSYSSKAILGSKSIGEPPICLAVVVQFAIREAVTAARYESGIPTTTWFPFDGPSTTESICLAACPKIEEYKFN